MLALNVALLVASLIGLLFESTRLLGIVWIALLVAFYPAGPFVLLPLGAALFFIDRFF